MTACGGGWASEDSSSSLCSSPPSSPRRTVQTPPPARPGSPLFAHQNRGGLYLSAYLISLAVLIAGALLWFLRDVVAPDSLGRGLANLGFAGGLLFLVGGLFSAGASFAMADVANHAGPSVLQTLNIFSQDVADIAGGATALLLGATSLAILRSRALPSWLAYLGLVFAIASFAIPMLGLPIVGLWLLLTSVVVLVTSRKQRTTT